MPDALRFPAAAAPASSPHAGPPPSVSVLMPTWNRARLLPEAIASVLRQTVADFELIIIDDGSKDETPAVLAGLNDPRVRTLRVEHQGISAALNAGLALARGTWIARLDSDDVWNARFLSEQLALAAKHPEAAAVYARAEAADAALHPKGITRGSPPALPGDWLGSLLLGDFTASITVIARREEVVRAGGWRFELPHGEDWDLWLRIARRGRFVFNPSVLALYREHETNITRCRWVELPDVRERILRDHFADPALPEGARRLEKAAFRRHHVNAAMAAWKSGRGREGLRQLREALRRGESWPAVAAYAVPQFIAWHVVPRSRLLRRLHLALLRWRDERRARKEVRLR